MFSEHISRLHSRMPSINKSQRNVVYKWLLFCMKAINPDFHKLSDLQRAGVNKRGLLKPPNTKTNSDQFFG